MAIEKTLKTKAFIDVENLISTSSTSSQYSACEIVLDIVFYDNTIKYRI